ncbi:MAG TPA: glutathione S-transferase family protein [Acidiferrobacteraceae bacterium]|nr:glutathione S-transferase family protein [Acidiferrobacteraceae bacterium]HEX20409.1 glutathione S-transferase family protein [Acidiferrobacteraceae bacterium]
MKLYIVNGSPNCRKVQALIKQLGLDVEIEALGFLDGDLQTKEFLAINPNGMVPALVDGDFRLWESNAIMQYLADKKQGNGVYPNDSASRANINRWLTWEQAHFNKAAGGILFEQFLKPNLMQQDSDPDKVAEHTSNFHRYAAVLNNHLASRQFITGDYLTLADFALASIVAFSGVVDIPLAEYPHISAWYQRVNQIPAWQQTAPPAAEALGKRAVNS